MENIHYEDNFFIDFDDLCLHFDFESLKDIQDLSDDWSIVVVQGELEPVFELKIDDIMDMLSNMQEERMTESGDEMNAVKKVLTDNIDFDKINSLMPKLYYPTGEEFTITKQNLINEYN